MRQREQDDRDTQPQRARSYRGSAERPTGRRDKAIDSGAQISLVILPSHDAWQTILPSVRRQRFKGAEVGARFAVNANRLNANVRRARLEVSVDTFANPRLVAACDDRVDQSIAAPVLELRVLP